MFLALNAGAALAQSGGWLVIVPTCLMILLTLALAAVSVRRISFDALQAQRTRQERSSAEDLGEFIRVTTHLDLRREPGPQLAYMIQQIFAIEAVAIFDADLHKIYQAGEWFSDLKNVVQNIYLFESVTQDPEVGLTRRVLRIGNLPIGALLLRGEISAFTSDAIASVVAITFDRYHSHANVSRTENARQAEQLRTAVLDSLAHAYKTPLTAIRAASTGLSEMGCLAPAQFELVALIDEQAGVLAELTTRLLKTARLQAQDLTLRPEKVAVAPLIDDVVASFRERLDN